MVGALSAFTSCRCFRHGVFLIRPISDVGINNNWLLRGIRSKEASMRLGATMATCCASACAFDLASTCAARAPATTSIRIRQGYPSWVPVIAVVGAFRTFPAYRCYRHEVPVYVRYHEGGNKSTGLDEAPARRMRRTTATRWKKRSRSTSALFIN